MGEQAVILAEARRTAQATGGFPGEVPGDLAGAYAMQEGVIAKLGRPIRGWKVAMIHPDLRAGLGADRTTGPILQGSIITTNGSGTLRAPVFAGGACALEAEFAVVLGKELSALDQMPDAMMIRDAIAAVHAGVEIASSPVPGIVELGPCATTSDIGINAGAILGPEIAGWDWSAPPESYVTRAWVGETLAGEGSAAAVPGGLIAALEFLLAQLATRGRGLNAGDMVLTGMTNGVHKVRPGSTMAIEFVGTVRMEIEVTAIQPS